MESIMPLRNEPTSAFSRFDLTLLIVNIIGAIIYLYAASPSWAIPEERAQGIHSVAGEPVVWAVRALPILTGFGFLDLLWGAYICVRRKWRSSYLWLSTAAIWLIATRIDIAHH